MNLRKWAATLVLCTAGMSLLGAGAASAAPPYSTKTLEKGLSQKDCAAKMNDDNTRKKAGADEMSCANRYDKGWDLEAIYYSE